MLLLKNIILDYYYSIKYYSIIKFYKQKITFSLDNELIYNTNIVIVDFCRRSNVIYKLYIKDVFMTANSNKLHARWATVDRNGTILTALYYSGFYLPKRYKYTWPPTTKDLKTYLCGS